jgi:hypothetical protein
VERFSDDPTPGLREQVAMARRLHDDLDQT